FHNVSKKNLMHLVWLNKAKVYPETFKTGHQTPKIIRFLISPLFHTVALFSGRCRSRALSPNWNMLKERVGAFQMSPLVLPSASATRASVKMWHPECPRWIGLY
ncbi:MAG: hypothetical protein ACLVIW_08780, partial [Bilophila wadsworthia]